MADPPRSRAAGFQIRERDAMVKQFFPHKYEESTYKIDFADFYKKGFRGILFDIDNTLVPHGAPADEASVSLLKRLKDMGFACMMLSNNKEPRVKSFCDEVGTGYIYKARKPAVGNYKKAMERLGCAPKNTLFVGDQLFTDIWGAKKAGIYTILVKPIHPREEIQIVLKRYLEKIVLYFYRKECETCRK